MASFRASVAAPQTVDNLGFIRPLPASSGLFRIHKDFCPRTLIVQNANAYEEGLGDFWAPFRAYWKDRNADNAKPLQGFLNLEATKWQYTHGTRSPQAISPDTWTVDQYFLNRAGNKAIQLQLFYDYGSNPPLYPEWQAYFRLHQPPTPVVWGKNDQIFPAAGAHPYRRDLQNIELHLLDTGHFAWRRMAM